MFQSLKGILTKVRITCYEVTRVKNKKQLWTNSFVIN